MIGHAVGDGSIARPAGFITEHTTFNKILISLTPPQLFAIISRDDKTSSTLNKMTHVHKNMEVSVSHCADRVRYRGVAFSSDNQSSAANSTTRNGLIYASIFSEDFHVYKLRNHLDVDSRFH